MELKSEQKCKDCAREEICKHVKRVTKIQSDIANTFGEEDTPIILSFSCKAFERKIRN